MTTDICEEKIREVFRRVAKLESDHLSEPRPRGIPEKIVQIVKEVFADEEIAGRNLTQ